MRRMVFWGGLAALAGLLAFLALPRSVAPVVQTSAPRDRPLAPTLADSAPLHILAFGTSLTARNHWPDRLAATLRACLEHPVTLNRVAAPGANALWGVQAVERVIAQAPDVVLIEFAINDADLRDGVSLTQAKTHLEMILTRLRTELPQTQPVLLTMSPATGLRGGLRPRLAAHYAQVTEIAAAQGLAAIDLYPRWLTAGLTREEMPDGLHPTDAATARVVDPALRAAFVTAMGATCPAG